MKRALHFAALMALLVSFSFEFWSRASAQQRAPAGITGYTLGLKINPSLNLAGHWGTTTSYNHGFLVDGQNRKMTSFDFPDAVSTTNYGISNSGIISGSYLLNNVAHGFLGVPGACK